MPWLALTNCVVGGDIRVKNKLKSSHSIVLNTSVDAGMYNINVIHFRNDIKPADIRNAPFPLKPCRHLYSSQAQQRAALKSLLNFADKIGRLDVRDHKGFIWVNYCCVKWMNVHQGNSCDDFIELYSSPFNISFSSVSTCCCQSQNILKLFYCPIYVYTNPDRYVGLILLLQLILRFSSHIFLNSLQ